MEEKPGEVLKRETVYKGRVFTVERDRVRLPKGTEATVDVVRHSGAVILLPMPEDGRVILVRQYRHAIGRWMWELAAGSLESGEEPAEGAVRECEEETGLVARRCEFLGAFYPTPGYCDEHMHFFKLTDLALPDGSRPAAQQDEDEDIRTAVFGLDEVRAMIRRGEIEDLKTVAGIALL